MCHHTIEIHQNGNNGQKYDSKNQIEHYNSGCVWPIESRTNKTCIGLSHRDWSCNVCFTSNFRLHLGAKAQYKRLALLWILNPLWSGYIISLCRLIHHNNQNTITHSFENKAILLSKHSTWLDNLSNSRFQQKEETLNLFLTDTKYYTLYSNKTGMYSAVSRLHLKPIWI